MSNDVCERKFFKSKCEVTPAIQHSWQIIHLLYKIAAYKNVVLCIISLISWTLIFCCANQINKAFLMSLNVLDFILFLPELVEVFDIAQ